MPCGDGSIKPWWPILFLTVNICLFKHWKTRKPLEGPKSSWLLLGWLINSRGPPEGEKSGWSAAHCMLVFLNFLVHPLVLPTDFMIPLWQHHHGFEGVWTKEPVGHHSAPSKSAGSAREAPSIVGSHFSWTSWVFPGTLHLAAELWGWSCTFLSFPFPLGSSVPGFQAWLMA